MEIQSIDGDKIEKIAIVCHEVIKAYLRTIGDFSLAGWSESSEQVQTSAKYGVIYRLMNPEVPEGHMHSVWYEFKKNDGWVHGEEANLFNKTHPLMVPYEELPESQKSKECLFTATFKAASKILEV